MCVKTRWAEFIRILFCRNFSFTSSLPYSLGCQDGYRWYTSGIQDIDTLDTREAIPLRLVDRGCVAIIAKVVVLLPVGDDDHAGFEANNKIFREQHFEVIFSCAGHS